MKAYTQSAGYAEQALGSIKVVHTYGSEKLELGIYSKHLLAVKEQANKSGLKLALLGGIFAGLIYSFYAYCYFFGSILRGAELENNSIINMIFGIDDEKKKIYTGGMIITIIFCMLMGVVRLQMVPNFQRFVNESKVATRLAFDVIDHVPDVNPN